MPTKPKQWTIHRRVIPQHNGWHRWDQAYQLLLA